MTTEYTTNFLQQKLYQLNVIHDMDHDFSTQKFSDRLGKIGKRIHNTAIALGALPGTTNQDMIHSGGAPGNPNEISEILQPGVIPEEGKLSRLKLNDSNFVEAYYNGNSNNKIATDEVGDNENPTLQAFIQNIIEMERQCDNDILNIADEYLCVDDICVGTYK